jgi:hypothetical protein
MARVMDEFYFTDSSTGECHGPYASRYAANMAARVHAAENHPDDTVEFRQWEGWTSLWPRLKAALKRWSRRL